MRRYLIYNENIRMFLNILRSSSDYVSGEKIAEKLKITRAQIFKIVKKLERLGYKFERKKGYKLLSFPDLPFPWEVGKNVILFPQVKSTQDEAKRLFESSKMGDNFWILALKQTKGRGRLERIWESPEGNFYGSVVLRTDLPMKDVVKVSLIGGLAVYRTIKKYDIGRNEIKIKWPNDVWVILKDGRARKISGCLAEAFGEFGRTNYVILGVGTNVKVSPLKDISICLKDIANQGVSLIDFTKKFLTEFDAVWKSFSSGKWFNLKTEIEDDMWRGRVRIVYNSHQFEGISAGISEDGSLIVQRDDATFEKVYYGDVFIKTIV